VATRTSASAGNWRNAPLPVSIVSSGAASRSRNPTESESASTGRRITRSVQATQKRPSPSGFDRNGSRTRHRSIRAPLSAISAGSSVTVASTETPTTMIAPTAIERIAFTSTRKRLASDTITVAPL
jgi:hypothetical protein